MALDLSEDIQQVGILTSNIVSLLSLQLPAGWHICLGSDKIKHFEKHKKEFSSDASYTNSLLHIPEIIASPEYVGLYPNGQGLEYIKTIDELTLVAIRLRSKNPLWVRSLYPLNTQRLTNFINSGRVKKVD